MIRHNIEHLPETVCAKTKREVFMRLRATQFVIYLVVIDYVVTVDAAGRGLQIWRAVDMRYAQFVQISGDRGRIVKSEVCMQLQTIRRNRDSLHPLVRA